MSNKKKVWSQHELIALTYLPSINATHCRTICEQFDSLNDMMSSYSAHPYLRKLSEGNIFFDSIIENSIKEAEIQIELCEKNNVHISSWMDTHYPNRLRNISYPPFIIYAKGQLENEDKPTIGIVGTRRSTEYGKQVTQKFTEEFVHAGVITISGLANGIDTFVHKFTIKEKGITYAIIASGIDKISPRHSAYLSDQIIDSGGAVISEYRCGTNALQGYFPQRNRIISGLSDAVLVIESGIKGGALITAQFAFEQNRPLFAIPGSIFFEKTAGTNALIQKNMAAMAISPRDILTEIGVKTENTVESAETETNSFEKLILSHLSNGSITIDELSLKVNQPTQELLSTLLLLEFRGLVRQLPGKQFVRS